MKTIKHISFAITVVLFILIGCPNSAFSQSFLSEEIIKAAKGRTVHETFEPRVCEVGGHSAWNKYVFTYDRKKRPVVVKHYKAWLEEYDKKGNVHINKKPHYFLDQSVYLQYVNNKVIQITKDKSGKIIEKETLPVE